MGYGPVQVAGGMRNIVMYRHLIMRAYYFSSYFFCQMTWIAQKAGPTNMLPKGQINNSTITRSKQKYKKQQLQYHINMHTKQPCKKKSARGQHGITWELDISKILGGTLFQRKGELIKKMNNDMD